MKWEGLYIGGLGTYIPNTLESSDEALRSGRLTREDHEKTQQISAAAGKSDETAPDMSVWAGSEAFAEFKNYVTVDSSPEIIVHAVALHTGLEAWNGSAYIGNKLGHPNALAVEIRNTCAGVIVGIDIMARYIGSNGYGLLTAAGIWRLPLFDRWASDSGLVYGDGAAAMILTRENGPFEVLSTVLTQNSRYEKIHRGSASIDLPEYREILPFSMRARASDYARAQGFDSFWEANSKGLQESVFHALQCAGVKQNDVKVWAVPHFGRTLLQRQFLDPLDIHRNQTTAKFGALIGHTGAADPLLGLSYLRSERRIRPGDYIGLIGIGAGFTWGCAILHCTGEEE